MSPFILFAGRLSWKKFLATVGRVTDGKTQPLIHRRIRRTSGYPGIKNTVST